MASPTFPWPVHCLPRILRAGRYSFSPDANGRHYQHPSAAIHQHFYRGHLFHASGLKFRLLPGDITISPPRLRSSYELEEAGHHWCVHFVVPPSRTRKLIRLPLHLSAGSAAARFTEKIRSLAELSSLSPGKKDSELHRASLAYALQDMLLWLAQPRSFSVPPATSRLEKALDQIPDLLGRNLRTPPAPAEIASLTGFNQNYLASRFKHRHGLTMDRFLLRLRLGAAAQLLATTTLSVKEVAFETGIPDAQYFNKQFRRLYGLSPTRYRGDRGPR